jgi:G3E family GTPase
MSDGAGPIPLTVVGGFLGAGKTSLLNHILSQASGRAIAVLVNDFGRVNVDAALIVSVTGETVSLVNGCVCCTIRKDLLEEVIAVCGRTPRPEHIVIETSGVSNPLVVADTFLTSEAQRFVELRAVIAVLDAELACDEEAPHRSLAMARLAASDLVVVNKTDLVSREARSTLAQQIRTAAPRARVWETAFGVVPLHLVFDDAPEGAGGRGRPAAVHEAGGDHGTRFAAWVFRSERRWTFSEIQRAVDKLPDDIYRGKGRIRLAVAAEAYGVFQMTGRRSWLTIRDVLPGDAWTTELVFVGTRGRITAEEIAGLFDEAVADARQRPRYLVPDLRGFTVYFGA